MTETDDSKSRRDLITRLVPYMALSAIKVGIFTSPLSVLTTAAVRYNESVEKTKERVNDIIPLLPGIEKLQMEVVGPNTVALVLQRRDIKSYAEQYLRRAFSVEGPERARGGPPPSMGEAAEFDYVLRLPSRSLYLKMVRTLNRDEASRLLELAKKLNPAEVWVFADYGEVVDARLGPVFVSESIVLRGRMKSVTTADMLYELFGRKFTVAIEPKADESVRVTLKLVG